MIRIIEEKCALRGYPVLIQNIDSRSNELEIANTKKARVETALLLKEVLGEQKVRELIEEIVGQGI